MTFKNLKSYICDKCGHNDAEITTGSVAGELLVRCRACGRKLSRRMKRDPAGNVVRYQHTYPVEELVLGACVLDRILWSVPLPVDMTENLLQEILFQAQPSSEKARSLFRSTGWPDARIRLFRKTGDRLVQICFPGDVISFDGATLYRNAPEWEYLPA